MTLLVSLREIGGHVWSFRAGSPVCPDRRRTCLTLCTGSPRPAGHQLYTDLRPACDVRVRPAPHRVLQSQGPRLRFGLWAVAHAGWESSTTAEPCVCLLGGGQTTSQHRTCAAYRTKQPLCSPSAPRPPPRVREPNCPS